MAYSTIESIINKNFKSKSGLVKQVTAALVCDEFNKIILEKWGDIVKDQAKALSFKDNTLTIASLSSPLAQEIKLHEEEILEKIKIKFPNSIHNIRYIV